MSRPIRDTLRQAVIYGLGNAGMSLLSLALLPIYVRYLTLAEYGLLALVLLYHAVMTRFYDLGMTNSVGRFFFDVRSDAAALGRMLATTQRFLFGHALVLSLLGWFAAEQIAEVFTGDPSLAGLFRIVAVTLFLEALTLPTMTLLRMEERAGAWVSIQFGRLAAALVLNIALVVGLGLGARGILLAQAVTAAGVVVVAGVLVLPRMRGGFDAEVLRRMLSFGLPFLPVLLGVLVIDLSDRYLLQWIRGEEEVGVYTLGYRLGQALLLVVTAFNLGWNPVRFRIAEQPDAREIYRRVGTMYWAASMAAVVAFGTLGREVVRLIATPEYYAAAGIVPLIALSYALYGLHVVFTLGMGLTKRTAALAPIILISAALNVGLNLWLIPRFGMIAAAGATVAAYVVAVVGTAWASERVYRVGYAWGRMGAIAVVGIAIVLIDQRIEPESVLAGVALGVAGPALFVAFLLGTGMLPLGAIVATLRDLRRRAATPDTARSG